MTKEDAKKELEKLKFEKRFYTSDKLTLGRKWADLCTTYRKPLWICIGLAFFSQAVGTSAFLYYGPEIIINSHPDLDSIDEQEESA